MRGFRHAITDEPDGGFLLRDDFRRGIGQLREFDMSYDLLIFPKHMPHAIRLVQENPDQKFVVDHIGNPNIRDGVMSPWDSGIAELGKYDNVFCKLSGMAFLAEWHRWNPTDFTPYLDLVFEAFGPDRLMIGSNWPVCTVSGDYAPVMNIVLNYVRQFSSETREKILGKNCCRFYSVVDDSES
jgi:L-fuconolactonase